ncbi:hypothetical protein [Halococcus sediminicola]|uniref:hypothetical protein n=1 Tax=Halococcus sediminicola TaxID=1264579 RepID=UPI00067845DF|nr:hypothetical protein [Halococcus sediminicola]
MTTDERALKDRAHGVSTTPRMEAGIESGTDKLDTQFGEYDHVEVNSCLRHAVQRIIDELTTHLGEQRGPKPREIPGNTATYQ